MEVGMCFDVGVIVRRLAGECNLFYQSLFSQFVKMTIDSGLPDGGYLLAHGYETVGRSRVVVSALDMLQEQKPAFAISVPCFHK